VPTQTETAGKRPRESHKTNASCYCCITGKIRLAVTVVYITGDLIRTLTGTMWCCSYRRAKPAATPDVLFIGLEVRVRRRCCSTAWSALHCSLCFRCTAHAPSLVAQGAGKTLLLQRLQGTNA
jgi:hypothetical protein